MTDRIGELRDFYQEVLQLESKNFGDDYSEFEMPGIRLTLFSQDRQEEMAPVSTTGGENGSMLLEVNVGGVDEEYVRIQGMGANIIKEPTNQPWGNRSFYFNDPAGNIVNFYEDLG